MRLCLSLLGLSCFLISCGGEEKINDGTAIKTKVNELTETVGKLSFNAVSDEDHQFSTEIPEKWAKAVNEKDGDIIINFYPKKEAKLAKIPRAMQIKASLTHIDIFPTGYLTGRPIGENHRLSVYEGTVPNHNLWNQKKSRVFLLGNGDVWAYQLYPKSAPLSWKKEGFIFAQIGIDNLSSDCYDSISGFKKDSEDCKPLEGDRVKYYGVLNPENQLAVLHALESFKLN